MGKEKRKMDEGVDRYRALTQILEAHPEIDSRKITFFAQIYYPVALLDVGIQERSFEDFSVIQKTVLSLIASGIIKSEDISRLMGVTTGYVEKIINLLKGYGHVYEHGYITPLGRESLKKQQLIQNVSTSQAVYVDGLNGTLIPFLRELGNHYFISPQQFNTELMTPDYLEGISQDTVIEAFCESDYESYREQYSRSRVKVVSVDNVTFKQMEFVNAFILKTEDIEEPILLFKKHLGGKNQELRHVWEPLYTTDVTDSLKGFNDTGIAFMDRVFEQFDSFAFKGKSEVERLLPVLYDEFGIKNNDGIIRWNDITKFDSARAWAFILSLCMNGCYIQSMSGFYGGVLKVYADNDPRFEELKTLLQLLRANDQRFIEWKDKAQAYLSRNNNVPVAEYLLKSAKQTLNKQ